MNKVLMITWGFPPKASGGFFRPLKFAKYLPRFGWKPVILTVKWRPRYFTRYLTRRILDPHFSEDILSGIEVYRSDSLPMGWIKRLGINIKWFLIPDTALGWLPFAVSLGKRIVAEEKIDVIYASPPPVTNFMIGAFLKRMTEKPLVVDYRDLWTGNPFTSYPTRFHYGLEKKVEERVLRNCDAVITVGEPYKEGLLRDFPFLKEMDVHVITNGYDPEDFLNVKPHKFDKFTMVHAGTLYGPRLNHFEMLLKALHRLLQHERVPDFQIVLIGTLSPSAERKFAQLIPELDLTNKVILLGRKSHRETIQFTLGSDVLLLIPGSPHVIPAKTFEYLATRNSILNISDPISEAARIINRAKAGKTVKPNVELLQEALHEVFTLKNAESRGNKKVLSDFSRISLTKNLASILDKLVG